MTRIGYNRSEINGREKLEKLGFKIVGKTRNFKFRIAMMKN